MAATWTIVKEASGNTLTSDMFTIYLAAMGISEGWSKYIGCKYSQPSQPQQ